MIITVVGAKHICGPNPKTGHFRNGYRIFFKFTDPTVLGESVDNHWVNIKLFSPSTFIPGQRYILEERHGYVVKFSLLEEDASHE